MASYLVRDNLSRGDLKISLSNINGYAQDAASVRWTIYSNDGKQVSGKNLPAIHEKTGIYYAPFFTNVPNGNYRVEWNIIQEFGSLPIKITDYIFVVDPSNYSCGHITDRDSIPEHGQFTFLSGQALGPGDLPLYLKNEGGFLQNAYAVFFTILDAIGNCMAPRVPAMNCSIGIYYAPYFVSLCSGNYVIQWEWMTDQFSQMKSSRAGFSVVDPASPFSIVVPVTCSSSLYDNCSGSPRPILTRILMSQCEPYPHSCGGGSCREMSCPVIIPQPIFPPTPTKNCCCEVEIPRMIHLPYGRLPSTGSFTNQPQYLIPECVHKITFYLTYAYGAPGGYALLQTLWGNGTDETPQTLIDLDININQPNSTQNTFIQNLEGPIPQSDAPVNFMIEVSVPGGSTTVRLIASEGGVPGIPGSLGITLTASSE